MAYALKTAVRVRAWELGAGSGMEKEMLLCGKIAKRADGTYELFSPEASEGKGQVAKAGDFFKVDHRGLPCPNERNFFLQNHRHLEGDWYMQAARPLKVWRLGDPECEEIRFLLDNRLLSVCPENRERCFSASLWGTMETAAADAVLIFYSVQRNPDGTIASVDFKETLI